MSETETLRAALAACVDAMRRGDMDYCDAHGVELIGDDEWNRALAAGEDALEATLDSSVALDRVGEAMRALASAHDRWAQAHYTGAPDEEEASDRLAAAAACGGAGRHRWSASDPCGNGGSMSDTTPQPARWLVDIPGTDGVVMRDVAAAMRLARDTETVRPLYDAPPDLARELAEARAALAECVRVMVKGDAEADGEVSGEEWCAAIAAGRAALGEGDAS